MSVRYGTAGRDNVSGGTSAVTIAGLGGDDVITGSTGNDVLRGDGTAPLWRAVQIAPVAMAYEGTTSTLQLTSMGVVKAEDGSTLTVWRIRNGTDSDVSAVLSESSGKLAQTLVVPAGADLFVTSASTKTHLLSFDGGKIVKAAGKHEFTWSSPVPLGADGNDVIDGGDGNDTISGDGGNDTLLGGRGDDQLEGGVGADRLDGGAGTNDIAVYWNSGAGVVVSLATGLGSGGEAQGDVLAGIEHLVGSSFDDVLTGDAGDNRLNGRDGNDSLFGGNGDDVLIGGAGMDHLDGGAGNDTASYEGSGSGVSVNLVTGGFGGRAGGDTYVSIENVMGSDWNDVLIGDNGVNRLNGGLGDDTLSGAGGNDQLVGGEGADRLDGGAGTDTANYSMAASGVMLSLLSGGTGGEAAGDSFVSIEFVHGSAFGDVITGDNLANRLTGDAGNDTLDGAGGNDVLVGGAGDDWLTGGAGYDVFWFRDPVEGNDVITDFWAGAGMTDRIWFGSATGLTSYNDVVGAAADTAEGLLLSFANGSVLLAGLATASLAADDFIFA